MDSGTKKVGWIFMAFMLMSDQIGYGILCMPKVYTKLGYLGGTIAVLIVSALTTYTGLLLARIHKEYPDINSYERLFSRTFSPAAGKYAAVCIK